MVKPAKVAYRFGNCEACTTARIKRSLAEVTCEVCRPRYKELLIETNNDSQPFSSSEVNTVTDFDSVIAAVMKYGANRWYALGEILFGGGNRTYQMTSGISDDCDKLLRIVSIKVREEGKEETAVQLLLACNRIQCPVNGSVITELTREETTFSQDELLQFRLSSL
jgi:hypothetical protein